MIAKKIRAFLLITLAPCALAAVAFADATVLLRTTQDCDSARNAGKISGRQLGGCKSCVTDGKGDVWYQGGGCGQPPSPGLTTGSFLSVADECKGLDSSLLGLCQSCVGAHNEWKVGTGCVSDPGRPPATGWIIRNDGECRNLTSEKGGVSCLNCLKASKKFIVGTGCK